MTETLGGLRLKEVSGLLEGRKSVCVQHSRPGITIITRLVTSGEDVVVERWAITDDDLVYHTHFLETGFLKRIDIKAFCCGQLMEIHVENGGREEFGRHKALVELTGSVDLRDKGIRNHFACLVMESVSLEHFRFVSVVLHELAR